MSTTAAPTDHDNLRRDLLDRARLRLREAEDLFRDVLCCPPGALPALLVEIERVEGQGQAPQAHPTRPTSAPGPATGCTPVAVASKDTVKTGLVSP